jgi:RsiW-degrading membrane proteinase PrsW (M82 family)
VGSVLAWSLVAIAIWFLWRRSTEPEVAAMVALLVQLAVWTPFFYPSRQPK